MFKNRKENFPHSSSLMNPSMSDIGKVSKVILDRMSKEQMNE